MNVASWLEGYAAGVAVRLYALIKIAMPWLVAGVLLSLLMPRTAIQRWAVVAVSGCFVGGWAILPAMGWEQVKEILFVLPGLAAGIWMGERTQRSESMRKLSRGTHDSTTEAIGIASPLEALHAPPAPAIPVRPRNPVRSAAWFLAARIAALIPLAAALVSLLVFPQWRLEIALGLAAYAAVLMFRPSAWLIILPATLPLLDLAHWSGRFFWDEFDLLMLLTLAIFLWQGRFKLTAFMVPKLSILLGIFVLAMLVSLMLGLVPLQPLDANAFSAYWSHYNSLRLAKGMLWGLVFFVLYRSLPEEANAFRKLSVGMALGVLGVSLWAIWEQALFAGAATTLDYRVTAGFSSMHTGGGHIEAYLVIALPFVWGLFFLLQSWFWRIAVGAVFLLGAYALFFTVARGGVVAWFGALLILMAGTWLSQRKGAGTRRGLAVPLVIGTLTILVMVAGVSGVFWKQRIGQTTADAGIRLSHWAEVLDLRDAGVTTTLFGQGLGTLPAANLASQLPDKAGSYRYKSDGGNTWLALNSAGGLYMAQRVSAQPNEMLRLEMSYRAPAAQAWLEASLCEKILFNSRQCQWLKVEVKPGESGWQQHAQTFSSGDVGAGNWLTRRPVQFSLFNPIAGTVIEVDNVRLFDSEGRNLLKNGDFSQGGDFWFFKSGDHLFWHAKNLWVHLLFEQGWFGLLLFSLIMMLALIRLMRASGRGEMEATVLLAAMGAWTIVGVVDSLVDAPRLALLVYGLLFMGAAWGAKPLGEKKRRRRRSHDAYKHGESPRLADTA